MTRANTRDAQVAYVAEVTPGVTPATPAFKLLRATDEDTAVERQFSFSAEKDGKRGQKNANLIGRKGSGGYKGELVYGANDDIIEGLLCGAWATDVIVDGKSKLTFTIETKFETGGTDIYKRLRGAEVESMSFNYKANDVATFSVGFMARASDFANAGVAGATYAAVNSNPVLTTADFASLTMTGLTVGCVASLDVDFKNNLDPLNCLGSIDVTDFTQGTFEASGKMSVVLSDDEYDLLQAYSAGTATSLSFQAGRSAGSRYLFELPNVIFEDMKVTADGGEGKSVLMDISWRALQSSSLSGQTVKITRAV